MLFSLRVFDKSEVAKQRMKIIRFYEQDGEKVTKEAFGGSRKVISRWRKRLKDNIIKRHKFFYQIGGRIYHDLGSKWAKRVKRLRIIHPLKPDDFGHIVSDVVERVTDGIKDYFL